VSGSGAPQQGFDASQELGHLERFGQIIVRAQLEPDDPIGDVAARREHEDRQIDATMPQFPADIESTPAGEHDIEDGQLEITAGRLNQSMLAVSAGLHRVAFPVQSLGEKKGEIAFVFDQQNTRAYDATSLSSASASTEAA
jgi:hypothetical protein